MKRFSIYILIFILFIIGIIIFNKPITNNEVIIVKEKKVDKKKMKEKLTLSNNELNIPLVIIEETKNKEKINEVLEDINDIEDDVLQLNGSEFYFWNFWNYFKNSEELEEDLWRI